jgi:glycine/D-amino acid oxidase-like deaminating enzyme
MTIVPSEDAAALPEVYQRRAIALPNAPPLDGDVSAGIVIIGGGYCGLSAALHLAEAGEKVVLLEARGLASGGSGRAFGQVVPYAKHGEPHLLHHFGETVGERLIQALGRGPEVVWNLIDRHRIACDDQRSGLLFAAHVPSALAGLEARATYWQQRGAPLEMLDAAATAAITGSPLYSAALLDRRGGHINPFAYAAGLAVAAAAAGATLHAESRAAGLARHGDIWRVTTGRGSVSAKRLVLCPGAYGTDLWPGLQRSVVPVRAHQLVTAPLSDNVRTSILPGGQSVTDTRRLYSGARMLPGGQLHLSVDGSGCGTSITDFKKAAARVRALFPQIGEPVWAESWTGWVDMSADQYPHLHKLADDAWAAIGLSGRGIAFGTLLGREIARQIMTPGHPELFMPVTPLKPMALRPVAEPLVAALMAWYRLRDRAELGRRGG